MILIVHMISLSVIIFNVLVNVDIDLLVCLKWTNQLCPVSTAALIAIARFL